jgi:hypothetical protein
MPMNESMTPPAESASSRWSFGGIALFCVSGFLLLSMGGAIIAAPLTVPLLFVVMLHRPTTAFRTIGALLAGATVGEVVWALTYVAADESKPWIWLLPLSAALATAIALMRMSSPSRYATAHT